MTEETKVTKAQQDETLYKVVLNLLINNRINSILYSSPVTDKVKVAEEITWNAVKAVSGFDAEAEKAATFMMERMPKLKKDNEEFYKVLIAKRIDSLKKGGKVVADL